MRNKRPSTPESVWSDESLDQIIRHAAELEEKLEYLRQNPVKRGLVNHSDDYEWLFIKNIHRLKPVPLPENA